MTDACFGVRLPAQQAAHPEREQQDDPGHEQRDQESWQQPNERGGQVRDPVLDGARQRRQRIPEDAPRVVRHGQRDWELDRRRLATSLRRLRNERNL